MTNLRELPIGVFDSGVGGLTVHHRLVERFPEADFVYLADQANAPYGGKTGEEIVELTKAGAKRLFDEGCDLAVLACNTAASVALRRLQQTWLPGYRRELGRPVNVLGIVVPTIEAATGLPWEHEAERLGDKVEHVDILGVFSTPATAASRVYEIEIDKRRQDVAVFSEPCPDLARMIEQNAPRADPRDPGLHTLRARRRPVPGRAAARHAADPPARRDRRRAGALFRAPPRVPAGNDRRSSLFDDRAARRAEQPG